VRDLECAGDDWVCGGSKELDAPVATEAVYIFVLTATGDFRLKAIAESVYSCNMEAFPCGKVIVRARNNFGKVVERRDMFSQLARVAERSV
jgi:hypothetical protein